jgi:hypothetical protein
LIDGAGLLRQATGPRDESSDFFGVIAHLNSMIVYDDGTAENRGIFPDESYEFRNCHIIEIEVILRNNLAARRNDIIGSVNAFGDDFFEVGLREVVSENILAFVGYFLFVEPFFDFAAAGAAGGIINFYHTLEL